MLGADLRHGGNAIRNLVAHMTTATTRGREMAKAETAKRTEAERIREQNEQRTDDIVTLCRDCRFCKLGLVDRLLRLPELARCQHEMAGTTDSVTGKRSQKHCSTMRIMRCGAEAKLFEPRESEQRSAAQ